MSAGLQAAVDYHFDAANQPAIGQTLALLALHHGEIVAERYAEGVTADTTLTSWSMAKSILHAVCGLLVRDGRLSIEEFAGAPEWQSPDDPRRAITVGHLLQMSGGLAFREDYVDSEQSDVIPMLFGAGKDDVAAFAASFPLQHAPGTFWSYASGTSNILSRVASRRFDSNPASFESFMRKELFDPLTMTTASPRFDAAGTWIGSSFCFATARDFAKFGMLYLRDGTVDGQRLLPEDWVEYAHTPAPACATGEYGAHWWIFPKRPDIYYASGYEGQRIIVAPAHDAVIVRLGKSQAAMKPVLDASLLRVVDAL